MEDVRRRAEGPRVTILAAVVVGFKAQVSSKRGLLNDEGRPIRERHVSSDKGAALDVRGTAISEALGLFPVDRLLVVDANVVLELHVSHVVRADEGVGPVDVAHNSRGHPSVAACRRIERIAAAPALRALGPLVCHKQQISQNFGAICGNNGTLLKIITNYV